MASSQQRLAAGCVESQLRMPPCETPFRQRALRRGVLAALHLACGTAFMAYAPQHASAQPANAAQVQRQYDIPAGPLDNALSALGAAAGVMVAADPALTAGQRTQGLKGSYTVADGLARLLAGTSLEAVPGRNGGYVLRRRPASAGGISTLEPVTVAGAVETAWSRVDSVVATRSAAGTKTDTPLIETPQSISVITRKQLDDQKPRSVSEALNYTPGVFTGLVGATNRYDYVALRGFNDNSVDNILLDGLRTLSDQGSYTATQIDPYFLERADVLRGPASVLYGRSSPGGVVALTSKQPTYEPYRQAEVTFGNRNRYEAGVDLSGPVDEAGKVAYRVTAMGRKLDTQFDYVKEERYGIAPSLNINFSDRTRLLLQAYLQHDPEGNYHGAVPADASVTNTHNGHRVPRSFFDGDPTANKYERTQKMLGYQFEHEFNDQVTFRQNFRHLWTDVELEQVYGYGWAGPDTLTRYYAGAHEKMRAYTIDNQLEGKFQTGALKHTLLGGLDYQRRKLDGYWASGGADPINVLDPQYGDPNLVGVVEDPVDRQLEQTGVYLQDQIAWNKWRFTLGMRYDDARVTNEYAGAAASWEGSKVTKRAGAVYLFENGIAPYVSYADGFNPSIRTDQQGQLLEPATSEQYEAGIRYQPPGGNSYISAAVYQLTQDSVASRAPTQAYYEPSGKVRSRGLELELRSELTDNLSLIASYTLNNMTFRESAEGYEGNTPYQAPKHMASAWLDWQFTPGVTLGTGVRYVGTSWVSNANTLKVDPYTLVDMMVHVDLGRFAPALKGSSLRLAATNLFDKTYVASCISIENCYWGEARNVMATLSYQW
ncbi:TonB-dependent siderophore receptor [Bordetella petrii]|uniref:TonB-dependent siderophore receptor n=1 Tax=Bordetella petrii TaxID=94624 RepID=UPI001E65CE38|nr:TonB-dependent siderophore receptor [Bordetella petrii]MCD0504057.1 TonB-dependent siderophore receptor [Bordetella petrii]